MSEHHLPQYPPHILAMRDAFLAEIHAAFEGVTRDGGVSWSESRVLDDGGSDEEQAAARVRDTDTSWHEVADDPEWSVYRGVGGFSFLDPIGFRYYLAAGLLQSARTGESELCIPLILPRWFLRGYSLDQWSLLDTRQRKCVRQYLEYTMAVGKLKGIVCDPCKSAYKSYWKQF